MQFYYGFHIKFLNLHFYQVKELTYIHSEGLLAGEMKHGPLALVDENIQILVIVTRDSMYEKMKVRKMFKLLKYSNNISSDIITAAII